MRELKDAFRLPKNRRLRKSPLTSEQLAQMTWEEGDSLKWITEDDELESKESVEF